MNSHANLLLSFSSTLEAELISLKKLVFLLAVLCSLEAPLKAQDQQEKELTKEETLTLLNKQIDIITAVKPHVFRSRLARLTTFQIALTRTRDAVEKSFVHSQTTLEFQNLIVMFRYSEMYFRNIGPELYKQQLSEVIEIAETFSGQRGIGDEPYTKVTRNIYTTIDQLLRVLEKQEGVSEELVQKIQNLYVPIGKLIGQSGASGDRVLTFMEALPVYTAIADLYEDFKEIPMTEDAYEIALQIEGHNQGYLDFSQFDMIKPKHLPAFVLYVLSNSEELEPLIEEISEQAKSEGAEDSKMKKMIIEALLEKNTEIEKSDEELKLEQEVPQPEKLQGDEI